MRTAPLVLSGTVHNLHMTRVLGAFTLVCALALGLSGCQQQELLLDVRPGRTLVTLIKTDLTVEGTGLVSDKASLSTKVGWDATYGPVKDGVMEVQLKAGSIDVSGNAGGASLNPELFRQALENVDLRLSVNRQGRTLAWSEDVDRLEAAGIDQAVFAATSVFRALGPQGVVLPKGALKVGVGAKLESDLAPVLGLKVPDENGAISSSAVYKGDENVGKRVAAKLETKSESKFVRQIKVRGQAVEVKGTSLTTGTAWVDRRTGLVLKSEWESVNTLDLGGVAGGITQKEKGSSELQSPPE